MKLQHALGGLQNLGPVNLEHKVFVQDWEKRIFGIHTVMMAESAHLKDALPRYPVDKLPTAFKDTWTWASLRTGAESMHPFEYFKFRYYEKWLMGISQYFIDKGYITAEELADPCRSIEWPSTRRTSGGHTSASRAPRSTPISSKPICNCRAPERKTPNHEHSLQVRRRT
jgi:hypothetical protein